MIVSTKAAKVDRAPREVRVLTLRKRTTIFAVFCEVLSLQRVRTKPKVHSSPDFGQSVKRRKFSDVFGSFPFLERVLCKIARTGIETDLEL